MRYAIFSDLHDRSAGLIQVELDAQRRQADRLIYLGDVGYAPPLFNALRTRAIDCVFGNWEVSGLARLPGPLREWVATWPASIRLGDVLCCHATPDLPARVRTTADAAAYMGQGVPWGDLFPRLHTQEEARWQAWAALKLAGLCAAFHGHTHVQEAWSYVDGRWRHIVGPDEFTLDAAGAASYLIGVGSAGEPQDGYALRYALYDDVSRVVSLIALDASAY